MACNMWNNPLFGKLTLFLSSVCVIHCMATPAVLIFLPAVSAFFSETIEQILVLSILPLSLLGFLPSWLRHRDYRLLALYISGIFMILFSQFFLHVHHEHGAVGSLSLLAWARVGVTFSGALSLASSIFINNRHTHYCTHPDHDREVNHTEPESYHKNTSM